MIPSVGAVREPPLVYGPAVLPLLTARRLIILIQSLILISSWPSVTISTGP